MPLTALQVKNAAPRERDYGLADGGGLFLWIRAAGGKSWRFRFRLDGKQSHISLGTVDKVTLAQARQLASESRQLVAQGRHPGLERKVARAQAAISRANTFKSLALEWHQHKSQRWSVGYANDVMEAFELDIFPLLGSLPLTDIKPMQWLQVFRRIESRGALEKLRKVRQRCQEVYRFAIATGRAEYNPISDIGGALQTPTSRHYPFLPIAELPELIRSFQACPGHDVVKIATRLLILTGVRTAELRGALWSEFDLKDALWQIPASRMKMRRAHLVPLSKQAVAALSELEGITGGYTLAFPGRNDPAKPMSEAAINQLLKRSGYDGRATGHGFRHTMSTTLHEQGYRSEWVETQLAHVDKNSIRGTYNHAQYLEGRREMLQWYAEHLEALSRPRAMEGKSHE
ncbi:tyrosine-type recombinase/integrase [Pseudomonas sp. SbB1]|uniref:Integrase family protein n=2 Tax=Pseudomonas TaxID=286 RepID=B0KMB5_PSEPG|nr:MULTISPECIES: tyrosine-type recombinase/integrase [unclassified Pseudomonas]ABY96591.1 integrase family protein [Pseudomonas putida GB-1]HDS1710918.1 tyrosine-type recombinase/integrase [Pseudomonas putida]MBP0706335.1 tyrosine-type recombinase/integrase [Pseudomonas sp. T34]NOG88613.1 tyrosine-type recombinase/integrase [Pseudomonas sp. SbB1]HDS1749351.1 tyrosine-type recombinase/integrase [Pseudomonas putida]